MSEKNTQMPCLMGLPIPDFNSELEYEFQADSVRSEAIQILFFDTSESKKLSLKFDRKALDKILENCHCKYGEMPISIISIVGPRRSGKTRFLHHLARHLCALEKNASGGFHGNKCETSLQDFRQFPDFLSSTSTKTSANESEVQRDNYKYVHSRGIWLWCRPFLIPCQNSNSPTMVFIMDTQGVFDRSHREEEDVVTFALALLLSSVTIVNTIQDVDENFLRFLHKCTTFGLLLQNPNVDSENCRATPFQNLHFLVRDFEFEFPVDCASPSDGGGFLKTLFSLRENDTLSSVKIREQIQRSFNDLKCSLLPHPSKIDGHLKQALEKVIINIQNSQPFSPAVFSKAIENYVSILNDPDFHGFDPSFDLCMKHVKKVTVNQMLDLYKNAWTFSSDTTDKNNEDNDDEEGHQGEKIPQFYFETDLYRLHHEAESTVFQRLENLPLKTVLCSSEFHSMTSEISGEIDTVFRDATLQNETRKLQSLEIAHKKSLDHFQEFMNREIQSVDFLPLELFQEMATFAEMKAIRIFKTRCQFLPDSGCENHGNQLDFESELEKLENVLTVMKLEFAEMNQSKKQEIETDLKKQVEKITREFKQQLENKIGHPERKFNEFALSLVRKTLVKFQKQYEISRQNSKTQDLSESEFPGFTTSTAEIKSQLISEAKESLLHETQLIFSQVEKEAMEKRETFKKSMVEKYDEMMKMKTEKKPDEFQKLHESVKEQVLKHFQLNFCLSPGEASREDVQEVSSRIDHEFSEIQPCFSSIQSNSKTETKALNSSETDVTESAEEVVVKMEESPEKSIDLAQTTTEIDTTEERNLLDKKEERPKSQKK